MAVADMKSFPKEKCGNISAELFSLESFSVGFLNWLSFFRAPAFQFICLQINSNN